MVAVPPISESALSMPAAAPSFVALDLADRLLEYLELLGVEYVFGVPGGAIEPFYNGLARSARRGGPRPVVARHETGAANMAYGYAQETGRLGVCCATTGPGTTNLITGVASAFASKVPMLALTAQTGQAKFGRGALQDSSGTAVDTVSMLEHCTRYNTLVSHPEQLENNLITAIMAAFGSPRGPAHLSVPANIFSAPPTGERVVSDATVFAAPSLLPDPVVFEALARAVGEAHRIVLFLGQGCGEAIEEIERFADMAEAAIITDPMGKRWADAFHPRYRGVFGFASHRSAREALADPNVDLVVAVGSDLSEFATAGWDGVLLNPKLIHIDPVPNHFSRSPMARLHVSGDLRWIFCTLLGRVPQSRPWAPRRSERATVVSGGERFGSARGNGESSEPAGMDGNHDARLRLDTPRFWSEDEHVSIKPQQLMHELGNRLPQSARVFSDASNAWAWTTHYLHLPTSPDHRGRYHIDIPFGAMGWAIGAAVGTALGCRDTAVVCITGDGCFLMAGQEVTVAVAERLPVIYVILNDSALGMVKHGQRLGGAEQIAYELPPVDFALMARALGAQGHTIRTAADLRALDFDALSAHPGPTVLDVYIDPEEVPPMSERIKGLKTVTPGQ